MEEIWKDIPQYEGYYQVSNLGNIPNPEDKLFINHIDGNKGNNTITNLEWCTASENMIHADVTG